MNIVSRSSELISSYLHRSNQQLRDADRVAREHAARGERFLSPLPISASAADSSPAPSCYGGPSGSASSDLNSPLRSLLSRGGSRDMSSSSSAANAVSRAVILCSRTAQPVERKMSHTGFGAGTIGLGDAKITALDKLSAAEDREAWGKRRVDLEHQDQQKKQVARSALLKIDRERHGRGGTFIAPREAVERHFYRKLQSLKGDKASQLAEEKAVGEYNKTVDEARMIYVREEIQQSRRQGHQKHAKRAEIQEALATIGMIQLGVRNRDRADSLAETLRETAVRRSSAQQFRAQNVSMSTEALSEHRQRIADGAGAVRKTARRCHSAIEATRTADVATAKSLVKLVQKDHEQNMAIAENLLDREHFLARKLVTKGHQEFEAKKREREEQRVAKMARLALERQEKTRAKSPEYPEGAELSHRSPRSMSPRAR